MQGWEAELAAKGRSKRVLNNLENNQAEQITELSLQSCLEWNKQNF